MLHLLLTKRNPIFSIFTVLTSQLYSRPCNHHLLSHCFSASATQDPHPEPHDFNMVDYLIASFGFSRDKALRISRPTITRLNTSQKPDAVRRFLSQQGFSEVDVKTLVTLYPPILCASVENTLEPNLRALFDIGLSSSTLTQLILSGPEALQLRSAAPRIRFWMDFFGGDELALIKIFKHNTSLVSRDISKNIAPKMSLLQIYGMSTDDVQRILLHTPRFFGRRVSALEDALKRAKELGFQPESGMFAKGLSAMLCVSREVWLKKMELLKRYGWSEDEFLAALGKSPVWIVQSEKNLKAKMDFLIGEAMCEPSYIASLPVILSYSLEKRLSPRHHVVHLLKAKGLCGVRKGFYHVICLSESKFVEIYILPHKAVIPTLHEAYLAASASGARLNILEN